MGTVVQKDFVNELVRSLKHEMSHIGPHIMHEIVKEVAKFVSECWDFLQDLDWHHVVQMAKEALQWLIP